MFECKSYFKTRFVCHNHLLIVYTYREKKIYAYMSFIVILRYELKQFSINHQSNIKYRITIFRLIRGKDAKLHWKIKDKYISTIKSENHIEEKPDKQSFPMCKNRIPIKIIYVNVYLVCYSILHRHHHHHHRQKSLL